MMDYDPTIEDSYRLDCDERRMDEASVGKGKKKSRKRPGSSDPSDDGLMVETAEVRQQRTLTGQRSCMHHWCMSLRRGAVIRPILLLGCPFLPSHSYE